TQDGATLSQALTYCDMLINEADCPIGNVPAWFMPGYPNRLEIMRYLKASFVAGLINIGVKLPSGQIPLDIMNIAYKTGLESNSIPSGYSLDQNQPNPFNPSTLIRFAVPKAGDVQLQVLNILGQKVRTLVNEFRAVGTHEVQWDGRDDNGNAVSSGVYLYRIQAGNFVETKKMVLMK
ncbi:MAG: T9SS type A sorting domain-containing protein, partial [candidate division Zixibacteria bacterium]|nr:T9SS type A sorting domain-containing protein [candidate division Zixibacteria bacterium]